LEALPNGVIARTHKDVTFENGAGTPLTQAKTAAVTVSMQKEVGSVTKSGTIGAGSAGGISGTGVPSTVVDNTASGGIIQGGHDGGVGLGTMGGGAGTSDTIGYGPEFTITFSTNPGVLKTIELDTRQVTDPGKTDYWVANARQGQFSSRYSTKVGRVNTLRYGSKLLYTSIDHRTNVPVNTLVKVGGQETMITAVQTYMVSLHDPFLGTSVIPILTDTKITGTGFSRQAAASGIDTFTFTTGGAGKVTAATIPDLANGAKLYANGCPFQSLGTKYDGTALADDAADLKAVAGNDCPTDAFSPAALVLYRRSDDPTNQNFYKTSGDLAIASNVAACATRGSVDVYTCAATSDTVASFTQAGVFTTAANAADIAANDVFFVNGEGPLTATDVTGAEITAVNDIFDTGGNANVFKVHEAAAQTYITPGGIMLMDGRRYKVKTTAAAVATGAKISLTETYAGGQFVELCRDCVTEVTVNGITTDTKQTLAIGDQLMVSGQTHQMLMASVKTAVADGTAIVTQVGNLQGLPAGLTAQNGAGGAGNALTGTSRLNLYKRLNGAGFTPIVVTESKTGVTYQYVSQCANRGSCDGSTGLCTCFKGYSNDNCDTQNMLAI